MNVPDNKIKTSLQVYLLHLADNALILGHRNSEWTGHGPILEQDIALSNIALDLIGQSRLLYQYAAGLMQDGSTEDSLAFLRDAGDFRNCLLAELPNGDWGRTICRQFFFSVYQFFLYKNLQASHDKQLSAIAAKSLKEVNYHLSWSAEWMIRLGDGTAESKRRMQDALEYLWPFTGELFNTSEYERELADEKLAADPQDFSSEAGEKVAQVLQKATLEVPKDRWMQKGGKEGMHTEHLGYLLAEMQFLQRAYPNADW